MMYDFEGDLLLCDTPDGGDVLLENGLFNDDQGFSTAVYLSLFGGNKEDAGKVKNSKTWWGNRLSGTTEAEKIISRFQNIITSLPITVKNIKAAESAAMLDLKWIIDLGVADKIEATGRSLEKGRFELTVNIYKDKNTIYKNSFYNLWMAA